MIFSVSKYKILVNKLRNSSLFRENASVYFDFPLYNAVEEDNHHSYQDILKIQK
jgi:hypothetical protein